MTDRHRQRRGDGDRGELHDDPRKLEHHVGHGFTKPEHRLLGAATYLRESDREQHGPENDLQHLVAGGRVEKTLRHDVLEHGREGDRLARRRRRGGRHGGRHTDTRFDDVDRQQPDEQRQRRDDFEVDDRFQREPADALHVIAVARDADDQRAENQRHDDRFDDPNEGGRDRKQRNGERGKHNPDRNAGEHRDDNPLREGPAAEEGPHRAA